jgi:NDP-sugar pyrophosphorylase family protein
MTHKAMRSGNTPGTIQETAQATGQGAVYDAIQDANKVRLPVLVVLAAGMGSRFGGDKQLAMLGSTERTLLHFSVLDAHAAGVRTLILVVRPNLIEMMRQQVLVHFPEDLTVHFVVQDKANVPLADFDTSQRQKPWGTAHALWSARRYLSEQPCIVINADDYYGAAAMQLLVTHFAKNSEQWAMVAFPLQQTLSAHGGVNRGICLLQEDLLTAVSECCDINYRQQQLSGISGNGELINLTPEQPVSMNIWGFSPAVLPMLTQALTDFFQHQPAATAECYLPAVVDQALQVGQELKVYLSSERWFGVTYPADLPEIIDYFQNHFLKAPQPAGI